MATNFIYVENTKFIFATNFAGDPEKDRFHAPGRKANIRLTEEQANELANMGVNVKMTKPNPNREYDEPYIPAYYTTIKLKYRCDGSRVDPKVYLVSGDNHPVLLDSESVGLIDDIWVEKVNVKLNPYKHEKGVSLYVDVMYVVQKSGDDPWASEFNNVPEPSPDTDDDMPFSVR